MNPQENDNARAWHTLESSVRDLVVLECLEAFLREHLLLDASDAVIADVVSHCQRRVFIRYMPATVTRQYASGHATGGHDEVITRCIRLGLQSAFGELNSPETQRRMLEAGALDPRRRRAS